MNTLVVPTARPEGLVAFLDHWRPWPWDAAVVIEDAPEVTLDPGELERLAEGRPVEVYSWTEIEAELPEPEIISRRDSAIRTFGSWKAWQRGATTILTLDDDCYRSDDLLRGHLPLERQPGPRRRADAGRRRRGLR